VAGVVVMGVPTGPPAGPHVAAAGVLTACPSETGARRPLGLSPACALLAAQAGGQGLAEPPRERPPGSRVGLPAAPRNGLDRGRRI